MSRVISKDKMVKQAAGSKSAMAGNKAGQRDNRQETVKLLQSAMKKHNITASTIPKFLKLAATAEKTTKAAKALNSYKEMSELFENVDSLCEYIIKTNEVKDLVSEVRTEAAAITKQKELKPGMDPLAYCLILQAIIAFLGAMTPVIRKMPRP